MFMSQDPKFKVYCCVLLNHSTMLLDLCIMVSASTLLPEHLLCNSSLWSFFVCFLSPFSVRPSLQSPPKGATIPYRPSPTPGTVLLAGNQVRWRRRRSLAGRQDKLWQHRTNHEIYRDNLRVKFKQQENEGWSLESHGGTREERGKEEEGKRVWWLIGWIKGKMDGGMRNQIKEGWQKEAWKEEEEENARVDGLMGRIDEGMDEWADT